MTEPAQPAGSIAPQTAVALLRMRAEQQPDKVGFSFISAARIHFMKWPGEV
jgi:hypothetical protein